MATISPSKSLVENKLIQDNMGLVIKVVQSFNPINSFVFDEYVQAGRIGLLKGIRKYNEDRSSFPTTAWNHVRWGILNYIKQEQQEQPLPITADPSGDPQKENIEDYLPNTLSDRERKVIILRTEGHTFKDIGNMHGFSKSWANYIYHSGIIKIQEANDGIYE